MLLDVVHRQKLIHHESISEKNTLKKQASFKQLKFQPLATAILNIQGFLIISRARFYTFIFSHFWATFFYRQFYNPSICLVLNSIYVSVQTYLFLTDSRSGRTRQNDRPATKWKGIIITENTDKAQGKSLLKSTSKPKTRTWIN